MPKNTTLPLAAVDPALESDQKADFGACQIVDLTQVDGEARVLVRLDQFVKPVALAELPVGGVFVRRFESDDQHTTHVLGCEFEHARVLSMAEALKTTTAPSCRHHRRPAANSFETDHRHPSH